MTPLQRLGAAVGGVGFACGVLLLTALAFAAIWPDLEAFLFNPGLSAERTLATLDCPLVLTRREEGAIGARFDNPAERPVRVIVRVRISQGYLTYMREINEIIDLAPGERRALTWPISADDRVYNRLILARVYQLRSAPLPMRARSCGILVVDAPGEMTGRQLVAATLVTAGIALSGGIWLWRRARPETAELVRQRMRRLGVLPLLAAAAFVAGWWGWWALGGVLLLLMVLLTAVLLERTLTDS